VNSRRGGVLAALILLAAATAQAQNPSTQAPKGGVAQAPKGGAAKSPPVDSLAILEKAYARDSSRYDTALSLGNMYLDRDRPKESFRFFEQAIKLKPNDARAWVNLGAAFDAAGSTAAAQERYHKALELAPGDPVANCRLASSLYASGKHTDAISLLREVIRDHPRSHCAFFTMGVAFADAGIYREAIRMWRKVIEIAPDSPEAVSARESIEVLEKFVGI